MLFHQGCFALLAPREERSIQLAALEVSTTQIIKTREVIHKNYTNLHQHSVWFITQMRCVTDSVGKDRITDLGKEAFNQAYIGTFKKLIRPFYQNPAKFDPRYCTEFDEFIYAIQIRLEIVDKQLTGRSRLNIKSLLKALDVILQKADKISMLAEQRANACDAMKIIRG